MTTFSLGQVLSITTDKMVAPNGMPDIYAILNYMTQSELYTHQLSDAADICKPLLLEAFPFLVQEDVSGIDSFETLTDYLTEAHKRIPSTYIVPIIGK